MKVIDFDIDPPIESDYSASVRIGDEIMRVWRVPGGTDVILVFIKAVQAFRLTREEAVLFGQSLLDTAEHDGGKLWTVN